MAAPGARRTTHAVGSATVRPGMRVMKRWMAPALLAMLSSCAVSPPPAAQAAAEANSSSLVREQVDPPQPLLEHPGKPPANGYVWIAGRWDLVDGRYRWQPGNWSPPRPGQIWLPHTWRRVGDRWLQEGGRWEPDPNSPARPRRR